MIIFVVNQLHASGDTVVRTYAIDPRDLSNLGDVDLRFDEIFLGHEGCRMRLFAGLIHAVIVHLIEQFFLTDPLDIFRIFTVAMQGADHVKKCDDCDHTRYNAQTGK
ncbi:MAG: hypothetical protein KBT07_01465 [Clostridiales bacterium]|nr:hypothetical protein [Candidatus Scatonaster coprocaballi]